MGKFLLRTISLLLFIGVLSAIAYLMIYPNQDKIEIIRAKLDIQQNVHNGALEFLVSLSPPNYANNQVVAQELDAIEYLTPELLAEYTNEGEVITNLGEENTTLYIKSIDVEAPIQEGTDSYAMMDGPWHFPISVVPGEQGNSVVIGHRFAEVPPSTNTFYNLDKVQVGDKIRVAQDKGDDVFTVIETKVVDKNDRTVLAQTSDHRITLITCHPLWTSDQRLVVIGVLDKLYKNI